MGVVPRQPLRGLSYSPQVILARQCLQISLCSSLTLLAVPVDVMYVFVHLIDPGVVA